MSTRSLLEIGDEVKVINSGFQCKVKEELGAGAQGKVYKVQYGDRQVALKWYKPTKATKNQKEIISELIKIGAPCDRFLWPIDLAISKSVKGFGYVMELRDPEYKSLSELVARKVEPSFWVLCTVGYQVADSYRQLHSMGYCYRDINFDNIFFDPRNGDVLICDNDNVGIDGESEANVLGTQRFMAPEVVRGEEEPSTKTDLFSLAVLLFYIFINNHPLHGKKESEIRCFDLPAMRRIYGKDPIFIFDPDDSSNRPQPGEHDNAIVSWPIYPEFFQDLFIQAFTEGLNDVNQRIRETQWRQIMIRLRDSIFYCSNCGAENFYESNKEEKCWNCNQRLTVPYKLKLNGKEIIMLNHNTKLYPHHIDRQRRFDFSKPAAKVIQHPQNSSIWGLKNLTENTWIVTNHRGETKELTPGKSAVLASGVKIEFKSWAGKIIEGGS